jgi:hypothetical protein
MKGNAMKAGRECAPQRGQGSAESSVGGERAVRGAITAFYTGAPISFNIFAKIDGLN